MGRIYAVMVPYRPVNAPRRKIIREVMSGTIAVPPWSQYGTYAAHMACSRVFAPFKIEIPVINL